MATFPKMFELLGASITGTIFLGLLKVRVIGSLLKGPCSYLRATLNEERLENLMVTETSFPSLNWQFRHSSCNWTKRIMSIGYYMYYLMMNIKLFSLMQIYIIDC